MVKIMNLKSELLYQPLPLNYQYSGSLLSQPLSSLKVSSGVEGVRTCHLKSKVYSFCQIQRADGEMWRRT